MLKMFGYLFVCMFLLLPASASCKEVFEPARLPSTRFQWDDILQSANSVSYEPKVGVFAQPIMSLGAPLVLFPLTSEEQILSGKSQDWECFTRLVKQPYPLFEKPSESSLLRLSVNDDTRKILAPNLPNFSVPSIKMPSAVQYYEMNRIRPAIIAQ